MNNAKASQYIDLIIRSGLKLLPSEAKVVEICKERTFQNKDLSASQAEALREIYQLTRRSV